MSVNLCTRAFILLLASAIIPVPGEAGPHSSPTPYSVLREPLPPEELNLSTDPSEYIIRGPTFTYRVQKATGAINALRVLYAGKEVVSITGPADIRIDQYRLSSTLNSCEVSVVSQSKDKVVLQAQGALRDPAQHGPELDYSLRHTFFNDGVVVSEVKLVPRSDLPVQQILGHELPAQGQFSSYIHKRRDEHGSDAARGSLPAAGETVRLTTLTSCLGLFSPAAALAIFTDAGATHLSRTNLETATIGVTVSQNGRAQVSLQQALVHIAAGDPPYLLKAGEEFAFRVGISLAPNRLPHRRMHDLRMFTWIGDGKFPYPTDEEITRVAHWGYTVFQMHRLGNPGEPRPPTGELERVVRKVHEMGMLFLWEENADLLHANAPGVQAMQAQNQWSLWQGFNYGGRYTAKMDPYVDMLATCLAAPNGMAEYRLANLRRMLDKFPVDGIYLDDNLAYPNCTLWREHKHPSKVYDCLIELHEMNWLRRQLLLRHCPHALLVSHCTKAFVLPVICDFDAQLFGEGYSFGPPEDYWNNYIAAVRNLPSQAMIWPGDDEGVRCATSMAYNYDLLTGGGQCTQIDWRLFPKKFPYAAGVSDIEPLYSSTYNLAQYYFGLYESIPFSFANSTNLFAATAPQTYASLYHNQVWNDWLIPIANMSPAPQITSLHIRSPRPLGLSPEKEYVLFDVHQHTAKIISGNSLNDSLSNLGVPAQNLHLYYLRQLPARGPYHLWGGKRISEAWDIERQQLSFTVQGPAGLKETLFIGGARQGIHQVLVSGKPAPFCFDQVQGLAHGSVTFTPEPLRFEVQLSPNGANALPEKPVMPGPLALRNTPLVR